MKYPKLNKITCKYPERDMDWGNFDLVTALRYAEDYMQFVSQYPAGSAS